jgi:xanthine dehydrogenase accessory factor
MFANKRFIRFLKECEALERDVVAITLLETEGSSYRKSGAMMLVDSSGRSVGAVSAGCFEEEMLRCTTEVLASEQGKYVVHDLRVESDTIECWSQGIGCNGVLKFWLEPFYYAQGYGALGAARASALRNEHKTLIRSTEHTGAYSLTSDAAPATWFDAKAQRFGQKIVSPYRLLILGAGPGCNPLAAIADTQGWLTTVADTRPYLLKHIEGADALCPLDSAEEVRGLLEERFDAVVIMSHVFNDDKIYIEWALMSDTNYIGILGSRKRTAMLMQALEKPEERLEDPRLHYPVGFDLGGSSPESIALAVCAEIEAERNKRVDALMQGE